MKIGAYGQMMFELEAGPTHGQIVPFSFWPPPHLSFGSGQSDTGNPAERERETTCELSVHSKLQDRICTQHT